MDNIGTLSPLGTSLSRSGSIIPSKEQQRRRNSSKCCYLLATDQNRVLTYIQCSGHRHKIYFASGQSQRNPLNSAENSTIQEHATALGVPVTSRRAVSSLSQASFSRPTEPTVLRVSIKHSCRIISIVGYATMQLRLQTRLVFE
jgi:hypothetical protein